MRQYVEYVCKYRNERDIEDGRGRDTFTSFALSHVVVSRALRSSISVGYFSEFAHGGFRVAEDRSQDPAMGLGLNRTLPGPLKVCLEQPAASRYLRTKQGGRNSSGNVPDCVWKCLEMFPNKSGIVPEKVQ